MQSLPLREDVKDYSLYVLERSRAAWQELSKREPSEKLQPLWSLGLVKKLQALATLCNELYGDRVYIAGSRLRQIAAAQNGDLKDQLKLSEHMIPFSDGDFGSCRWKVAYDILANCRLDVESPLRDTTARRRLARVTTILERIPEGCFIEGEGGLLQILRDFVQPKLAGGPNENLIGEISEECRSELRLLSTPAWAAPSSHEVENAFTLASSNIPDEFDRSRSNDSSLIDTTRGSRPPSSSKPLSVSHSAPPTGDASRERVGRLSKPMSDDNDSGYGTSLASSRRTSFSTHQGSVASQALKASSGLVLNSAPALSQGPSSLSGISKPSSKRQYPRREASRRSLGTTSTKKGSNSATFDALTDCTVATGSTGNSVASSPRPKFVLKLHGRRR